MCAATACGLHADDPAAGAHLDDVGFVLIVVVACWCIVTCLLERCMQVNRNWRCPGFVSSAVGPGACVAPKRSDTTHCCCLLGQICLLRALILESAVVQASSDAEALVSVL